MDSHSVANPNRPQATTDFSQRTSTVQNTPPATLGAQSDNAEISPAAQRQLDEEEQGSSSSKKSSNESTENKTTQNTELTTQEQQVVNELKQRDRAVRQHEQAHKAVAGSYAMGGPFYQYQTGPDGKRYAVGGHVSIDTGKEGDAETTIRKMETVRRAALAPSDPSPQDRSVAAQATRTKQEAIMELRLERAYHIEPEKSDSKTNTSNLADSNTDEANGQDAQQNINAFA